MFQIMKILAIGKYMNLIFIIEKFIAGNVIGRTKTTPPPRGIRGESRG